MSKRVAAPLAQGLSQSDNRSITFVTPDRASFATSCTLNRKEQVETCSYPSMKSVNSISQRIFDNCAVSRLPANYPPRMPPSGEARSSIAAGPSRIIIIEGKISSAMGNTILMGAL